MKQLPAGKISCRPVMPLPKNELKLVFWIALLAIGLRLAGICFDSLWLDEAYQSLADAFGQALPDFLHPTSQPFLFTFGPPQDLVQVLSNFKLVDPLCPPLYALLLNRWMLICGTSDLAIRSLSALSSVLSLLLVFAFSRKYLGFKPAVFATLLQAVSPFDIYYAQEARMYSLLVCLSALSCFMLWSLLQKQGKWVHAVLYVLSSWALINTHYTALFLLLFQGLWSLGWCWHRRDGRLFLQLCFLWLAIGLLWLPWLDIFRHASSIRGESFYVARKPSWSWPILALISRIPFNWMTFLIGKKVTVFALGLYLTSACLLLLAAKALWPGTRTDFLNETSAEYPGRRDTLLYVFMWALLPCLSIWLLDVLESRRVIEISRYVITSAPAVYIWMGWGLAVFWSGSVWIKRCFWLHVICALVNNLYAHVIPQREAWAQAAQYLEAQVAASDLLLVSQYYNIVCLDRYLHGPRRQIGVSSNFTAAQLEEAIASRQHFWLLTAQEGESVKSLIPSRFRLSKQIDFYHALHLRLYKAN